MESLFLAENWNRDLDVSEELGYDKEDCGRPVTDMNVRESVIVYFHYWICEMVLDFGIDYKVV